jgi:conjugative relaxase-like TrwC/TraI family protein
MSAASIGAAKGGGYVRYLEAKTVAPERGDYYLSRDGELTQAPGRWLLSADTRERLGISGETVDGKAFVALMEGRHPVTGRWLRPEGAGGGRGGGIDLTFSAPKSISTVWALGSDRQRADMEAAHASAVAQAMEYVTETIPAVRRRYGGVVVEEPAKELIAAEYRHTTARSVLSGDAPDPQLHSHVVVTGAIREDDRIVAVSSRPLFAGSREAGAFYRSALANELAERGYAIAAGTGKNGRYFEIAGVPRGLLDVFSARSREVGFAIERFRAKYGRAPERGELQRLKLANRKAKTPATQADLMAAWTEKGERYGFTSERTEKLLAGTEYSLPERPLIERVEQRLTERAPTFTPGELRAVILEQSVGVLSPAQAAAFSREMIGERRVVPLEGGRLTTLAVRAMEQTVERHTTTLAAPADREVGDTARELAKGEVSDRIAGQLSNEQVAALETITGPERAAVLIGPAGTGKGVVIDAAARAEQLTGRETVGVAVSWSTAERLGADSPALAGCTFSVDAFTVRANTGRITVGKDTTIYLDEAGMADTRRLANLTSLAEQTGAKLVLVGDGAQLPAIGAGGMFDRITKLTPTAELSDIRRTLDPATQRAWADLRAGRSDRAMAHYQARGRLHMTDTRDDAVERAVQGWAMLTEKLPIREVALISDASNQEINRMNARAQHYRAERGELGHAETQIPGVHYGIRQGDRVALVKPHHTPDQRRVENGSHGEVLNIAHDGAAVIKFDRTGEQRVLSGQDLAAVRLGYAQHIYRMQGATVDRAIVVTGGWQASQEPAYVEASRARHGVDWYINREDLGTHGHDQNRIDRFAANLRRSSRQNPSLAHPIARDHDLGHDLGPHLHRAPSHSLLPSLARSIQRLAKSPASPGRSR